MKKIIVFLVILKLSNYIFSVPPPYSYFKSFQDDKTSETVPVDNKKKFLSLQNKISSAQYPASYSPAQKQFINFNTNTSGTIDIVVICIKFTDRSYVLDDTEMYDKLFNPATNSMTAYYKEVSYGKANIQGTVYNNNGQWYQSSHESSYYGRDSYYEIDGYHTDIYNLVKEAVILSDTDIDFSQFDSNNDSIVDHVMVMHNTSAQEFSDKNYDIWSHRWYIGGHYYSAGYMTNDNVRVLNYTLFSADSPLGVITHEFGHDLGLPDFYCIDSSTNNGIGNWGLMGYGVWLGNPAGSMPPEPSVWSKIFLGWVEPERIQSSGTFLLKDIYSYDTGSAYKISYTEKEYVLLSYIRKTGYNVELPAEGLLIWHVDENIVDDESLIVNAVSKPHLGNLIVQADGRTDLENGTNLGDVSDVFPGSLNKTEINNTLYANLRSYYIDTELVRINIVSSNDSQLQFNSKYFGQIPVTEGDKESLIFYPNPLTSHKKLKYSYITPILPEKMTFNLYDIAGNNLGSYEKYNSAKGELDFNVETFAPGIYFLHSKIIINGNVKSYINKIGIKR